MFYTTTNLYHGLPCPSTGRFEDFAQKCSKGVSRTPPTTGGRTVLKNESRGHFWSQSKVVQKWSNSARKLVLVALRAPDAVCKPTCTQLLQHMCNTFPPLLPTFDNTFTQLYPAYSKLLQQTLTPNLYNTFTTHYNTCANFLQHLYTTFTTCLQHGCATVTELSPHAYNMLHTYNNCTTVVHNFYNTLNTRVQHT